MLAPPIHYVTTRDGLSIAYTDSGAGEPFIFLPAFFNHVADVWTRGISMPPLLEGLAKRFRVVNFDSRGLGMSTRGLTTSITFEDYFLDLEAVIERLKLNCFTLLGSCSTVFLAAHYAARHPERVNALVLMNAAMSWEAWRLPAVYDELPAQDWDLFLQNFIPWGTDPQVAQRVVDVFHGWITQSDYLTSVPAWRTVGLAEIADRIQTPTLILHSRQFRLRSMEAPLEVARALPNARLEFMESNQLFGEPGQALDAIDRFMCSLEGTPNEISQDAALEGAEQLTPRESEVLRLIAKGETNRDIAERLVISIRTVERHITHIYSKIGARGKADATAYALRHEATSARQHDDAEGSMVGPAINGRV
jgi:pimeloyl-ACP methyl ester carboxylesterase/DNA-binding CsgD family transcriptional regulator